jgi:hypothetical protein
VEIECGNAVHAAAFPLIHKLYGVLILLWFITITTTFPSSFINAVVSNWLRLLLLIILLAPGLMNFEKCPI